MSRLSLSHPIGVCRWTWKPAVAITVVLFSLIVLLVGVHGRSLPEQTSLLQLKSKQQTTQLHNDRILVRYPRKASQGSRGSRPRKGKIGKRKRKKHQNEEQLEARSEQPRIISCN